MAAYPSVYVEGMSFNDVQNAWGTFPGFCKAFAIDQQLGERIAPSLFGDDAPFPKWLSRDEVYGIFVLQFASRNLDVARVSYTGIELDTLFLMAQERSKYKEEFRRFIQSLFAFGTSDDDIMQIAASDAISLFLLSEFGQRVDYCAEWITALILRKKYMLAARILDRFGISGAAKKILEQFKYQRVVPRCDHVDTSSFSRCLSNVAQLLKRYHASSMEFQNKILRNDGFVPKYLCSFAAAGRFAGFWIEGELCPAGKEYKLNEEEFRTHISVKHGDPEVAQWCPHCIMPMSFRTSREQEFLMELSHKTDCQGWRRQSWLGEQWVPPSGISEQRTSYTLQAGGNDWELSQKDVLQAVSSHFTWSGIKASKPIVLGSDGAYSNLCLAMYH